MATELDKIKSLLINKHGARTFVEKALKMGFYIVGEDQMGLTMKGKNCRFVLTVLASKGRDKIYTLSFKHGNNPVITLVDEGKINFTYHPSVEEMKLKKTKFKENSKKNTTTNLETNAKPNNGCLLSSGIILAISFLIILLG